MIAVKVHHIMTKEPVTLKPTDTLLDAMKVFLMHNISGCPVVSRGKLVGVITQSDIIKSIDVHSRIHKSMDAMNMIMAAIKSESYNNLKPAMRRLLTDPVKSHCTNYPVWIDSKEDVYQAAKLINKHNIDRLPVLEEGRLVGIISKIDILRAIA